MNQTNNQQKDFNQKQLEANKNFIKLADVFIAQANKLCEVESPDHQLINAALLYASARFSAFITASMSASKANYDQSTDKAIEFYTAEFNKMLKEHMKQYGQVLTNKEKTEKQSENS
ncbi:hypothetical protein MS2017_2036 [Bathymodiolus thermophilus thioautotrophic gill symbiont]|uniref:DUF3144 domain-containing protein n=1 Tax=Bathymodiolus thermophilus thioautotrophic gill symbiont TaxID=2360 RepID=A0A3G3IQ23_9GAMM|nr:DUF3144 domain-containing protein [Bathymodiolus thermophilus thioautotrophic gill symbiont]AYQ57694.1 hypothetical protein MS2017_2036 [Bathymodiolus thermophilus thioautotrophic gill symbiont]